jgi:vacuolar protein-sorting-associated protein 4
MVDGVEKLTPCSPGDEGAIEMDWTMIESEKLQESPLLRKDFEKAIKSARPTVSAVDIEKHQEWTNEFGSEGA